MFFVGEKKIIKWYVKILNPYNRSIITSFNHRIWHFLCKRHFCCLSNESIVDILMDKCTGAGTTDLPVIQEESMMWNVDSEFHWFKINKQKKNDSIHFKSYNYYKLCTTISTISTSIYKHTFFKLCLEIQHFKSVFFFTYAPLWYFAYSEEKFISVLIGYKCS